MINNSHYEMALESTSCVNGILPRFFAAGKPLPKGHRSKMRITVVMMAFRYQEQPIYIIQKRFVAK